MRIAESDFARVMPAPATGFAERQKRRVAAAAGGVAGPGPAAFQLPVEERAAVAGAHSESPLQTDDQTKPQPSRNDMPEHPDPATDTGAAPFLAQHQQPLAEAAVAESEQEHAQVLPWTDQQINAAVAEEHFNSMVKMERLELFQRPNGTEGYRGMDLSGLWIYKRPDGSMIGINRATPEDCRNGNISELAKKNDYCNSLDAVAEALETLTSPQRADYIDIIEQMFRELENDRFGDRSTRKWQFNHWGRFALHTATARQRCVALLRVLGKHVQ